MIGGFVAAEGTFTGATAPRPRFIFAVGLGAIDAGMCDVLHAFFGVGSVTCSPRRKAHYDDEVTFAVRSARELVEVVVPFMDEHLPASHKREQYESWRARLLEHWKLRAKRVRPCTVAGCERPRRAHGLCRHHLFRAQGT
jgi:hypothetical protein